MMAGVFVCARLARLPFVTGDRKDDLGGKFELTAEGTFAQEKSNMRGITCPVTCAVSLRHPQKRKGPASEARHCMTTLRVFLYFDRRVGQQDLRDLLHGLKILGTIGARVRAVAE